MSPWNFLSCFGKRGSPPLVMLEDTGTAGPLAVQLATDTGNVRTNNEDLAVSVYPRDGRLLQDKGVLLVLADGMGGHQSGEVASRMAVERVSRDYFRGGGRVMGRLADALAAANAAIHQAGQSEPHRGMGTTCTAVTVVGSTLFVAHVGDSRAYHLHRGKLTPMTVDQTYVGFLAQQGRLSEAEMSTHPQRNVLMQALGSSATVSPEVSQWQDPLEVDDLVMLCSDGLYEYLSDNEIAVFLTDGAKRPTVAYDLVAEAKRRGGHDNITVLIAGPLMRGSTPALKATRESFDGNTSNP